MFSIDQNCHSLWDVIPKLQALAAAGHCARHFIEDIDVAFTAVGASADGGLRFARERLYGSGGGDWGPAMFYSELLGRLPVELRHWELMLGMKLGALARQLGRSIDDLYDELSPGDNWQLIGPSYVGDRQHHRLVGDLTVAEVQPLLGELMDIAERDMRERFPAQASQKRTGEWFSGERGRLESLLGRCRGGRLVDLYRLWMADVLGDAAELDVTSSLVATGGDPGQTALLDVFVRRYDLAAELYSQAIAETDCDVHPLRTSEGELPFFAVLRHQGRLVRSSVFLDGAGVRIGERLFPLADGRLPVELLRAGGVCCLAGKALVLVIQARLGDSGGPLAVPFNGSLYMPAAFALQAKLAEHDLLPARVRPVVRVRFHLLDRLASLDTPIRLPAHLVAAMGCEELPASRLAADYADVAAEASARLAAMTTDQGRRQWQRDAFATAFEEIAALNERRRRLARADAKSAELRDLSHRARKLEADVLAGTLRQVALDWQVSRIDYWDSRGAIMPWCVALGGEEFYDEVISRAEIYEDTGQV